MATNVASRATRNRFPTDRGLTARMTVTAFLIGALYAGVITALIFARLNIGVIVVIAAILLFCQYYFSDQMALYAMHGRVVTPEQAPQLHAVVDRLCALANMQKPAVAIANTDVPNAFATGRNPNKAVLCVTTGILRRLNRDELEGVLSHELSHVAHRDVAVMTIAGFLGVVAGFFTRILFYSSLFGGFGGRGGRGGGNNGGYAVLVFLAMMVFSMVVYTISFLLTRTLSRYRELSADRSGAILTGQPSALASALVKVTGDMGKIPTNDLRHAEPFNAFFFAPAKARGFSLSTLFSTHPPLEVRLRQLTKISQQLGQAAV